MPLPAPGSRPSAADEPVITALVAERCPRCGARLGPAAQWCSLCFADLRPAPTPPPSAEMQPATTSEVLPPPRVASPPAVDPGATGATGGTARPTWPCSSCGVAVDVDLDACPACGTGFLGALRNSTTGIELPLVGDLGRFSNRSRAMLGAVVGIGLAIVLVLITALLGR